MAEKYIRKGQLLYVEGKVTYSSYDDKDGNKKYITEIIASNFQMLGKKPEGQTGESQSEGREQNAGTKISNTDDLPF